MAAALDLLLNIARLIVSQWKLSIGLLFMVLFGLQTYRIGHYESRYNSKVKEYEAYQVAIKEKMAQALIEAQTKTIAIQKQKDQAEMEYNESIKTLQTDNDKLDNAVSRLSKQLNSASSKLNNAPKDACIKYSRAQSDVFTRSTQEYIRMAENADRERAERLRIESIYEKASD